MPDVRVSKAFINTALPSGMNVPRAILLMRELKLQESHQDCSHQIRGTALTRW